MVSQIQIITLIISLITSCAPSSSNRPAKPVGPASNDGVPMTGVDGDADGDQDGGADETDDAGSDDAEDLTDSDDSDDETDGGDDEEAKYAIRYPVVHHHGLMDGSKNRCLNSFATSLKAKGISFHRTEVAPAESIAVRADQLKTIIDRILTETGAEKVNIIAHSMGGLDARHLISTLGYADRVASLTTIATPHRGTPIAETAESPLFPSAREKLVTMAASMMSSSSTPANIDAAIANLTPTYLQTVFNPATPDATSVKYWSVVGKTGLGSGDSAPLPLLASTGLIQLKAGANDGMVPVESAKWGTVLATVAADHMDLAGCNIPFMSPGKVFLDIYDKVLRAIETSGF